MYGVCTILKIVWANELYKTYFNKQIIFSLLLSRELRVSDILTFS